MKYIIIIITLSFLIGSASCSKPFPDDAANIWLFDWIIESTFDRRNFFFLTESTNHGDFKTNPDGEDYASGLQGADAFCTNEKASNYAALPGAASEYVAFLSVANLREACSTANCADGAADSWILIPDTEYYRATDKVIFTTNSEGIFSLPLAAPLIQNPDTYWTGMDADWTTDELINCEEWKDERSVVDGEFGTGNNVDQSFIHDGGFTLGCDIQRHLLCFRKQ